MFENRVLLACVLFSLTVGISSAAESPAPLKSAFAERDITPEIGMERPGGYGKVFHRVLHDPCKVRAVVFDDGENRVAIVSVDALLIRRVLVEAARIRIQQQAGIEPGAILIHATHSHSSGPTGMIYPGEVGRTVWTFAKEIVLLEARLQKEPVADVEVQAIQVGPAIFLTDPAEFFCQLGLDIKEGSPFPYTFPVSLANGCVGYVPTEEAFGRRGGGYETRLTSYSNLEITAGTQMVNAAIVLSKTMTPDKVPTRGPAPKFNKNAWDYGSVPPELD